MDIEQVWKQASVTIRGRLTKAMANNVLPGSKPIKLKDGTITIEVSPRAKTWLDERLHDIVLNSLTSVDSSITQVKFIVPRPATSPKKSNPATVFPPRQYIIAEYPLIVLPTLATWIGLNEALFLQQLHYWLGNSKIGRWKTEADGTERKYIRNTAEEWETENFPFWSNKTLRTTIYHLEDDGLILSRDDLNVHKYDDTKWYTINYGLALTLSGPVPRQLKKATAYAKSVAKRKKTLAAKKAKKQNNSAS